MMTTCRTQASTSSPKRFLWKMQSLASQRRNHGRRRTIAYVTSNSSSYLHILTTHQTKMRTFLDVRPTILDDIVTLDGPGNRRLDLCGSCGSVGVKPVFRCIECSYSLLRCGECTLKSHAMLPLHRLEVSSCFRSHISVLTMPSVGRVGFSTGPPSIRLGMSVTLGTTVIHAPPVPQSVVSRSSTPTVGTTYKSGSANAVQVVPPARTTHWGQGVVYRASTSQVHCKEIDNVPSIYPLGTSQVHSGFSLPISMQFSQPRK